MRREEGVSGGQCAVSSFRFRVSSKQPAAYGGLFFETWKLKLYRTSGWESRLSLSGARISKFQTPTGA
jgi:hypothetical protein